MQDELVVVFKDREPCKHTGCLNHVLHPCDGCGRIAGNGEVKLSKSLLENWERQKNNVRNQI